ncbi:hypothetical protein N431DRAFT_212705 [Stipitochalara longipes BDJ]|nr:hypothetical protein N431DRAFT_212705 [Stipitochalara longipes BDJ]
MLRGQHRNFHFCSFTIFLQINSLESFPYFPLSHLSRQQASLVTTSFSQDNKLFSRQQIPLKTFSKDQDPATYPTFTQRNRLRNPIPQTTIRYAHSS